MKRSNKCHVDLLHTAKWLNVCDPAIKRNFIHRLMPTSFPSNEYPCSFTVCTEYNPGKDCFLPCSEHPHLHHAREAIGKTYEDHAKLLYAMQYHHSEHKNEKLSPK